jgi:hypothetical protein
MQPRLQLIFKILWKTKGKLKNAERWICNSCSLEFGGRLKKEGLESESIEFRIRNSSKRDCL